MNRLLVIKEENHTVNPDMGLVFLLLILMKMEIMKKLILAIFLMEEYLFPKDF